MFNPRVQVFTVISAIALCIAILSCQGKPMDILEDIGDYLEAADSSPKSGRMTPQELCKMPIRKGVCRALIPRWSYDPKTKRCREFKFGGCDGNANNFVSEKNCLETCKGY